MPCASATVGHGYACQVFFVLSLFERETEVLDQFINLLAEHGVDLRQGSAAEGESLAMAAATGLGIFHSSRTFKISTGLTPHQFVLQRRLQRAQQLLAIADRSIAEIAARRRLHEPKPSLHMV